MADQLTDRIAAVLDKQLPSLQWNEANRRIILARAAEAVVAVLGIAQLINKWSERVAHYDRNITAARSYESALIQERMRDLCQEMLGELVGVLEEGQRTSSE